MRYNKRFIWQSFFVRYLFVIPVLYLFTILVFATNDEGLTTFSGFLGIDSSLGFLIGVGIILIIYGIIDYIFSYLYWKKTTYEIGDKEITLESGVIFKRNIVIEFTNIHAININRSFFARMFGLSQLCIDSGNTASGNIKEIVIYDLPDTLSKLELDIREQMVSLKKQKIRKELDNTDKREKKEKKVLSYNITKKMKRRMVFFSFLFMFLAVFIITFSTIGGIIIAIGAPNDYPFSFWIFYCLIYVGFVLILYMLARIFIWIKYHNFKISYDDEEIAIEYGLIHQWKYYIARNRIKALVFIQDVIQKKAKFGSVELRMVGLQEVVNGNNFGSFIKLFPYIDIEILNKGLEELNIGKKFKMNESTCRKNSFIYFLLLPLIVASIFFIPMIIAFLFIEKIVSLVFGILFILYIVLVIILGHIRKKNQSVDFDNDNLYLSSGSIFKYNYIIPWKSVVSIGTKTTFLREKDNIVSIVIRYFADKEKAVVTVAMQDMKTYGELLLFFESIKNK